MEAEKIKFRGEYIKDGKHYITLGQVVEDYLHGNNKKTEDAQFEIIDNSNCMFNVKAIEDRLKQLGALEDIECEIIEPNNPDDLKDVEFNQSKR